MKLYRFSPIHDASTLTEAVTYTAALTAQLSQKLINESFPISSLTLFSHYPDEYANLQSILTQLGSPYDDNNGPRVSLHAPIKVNQNTITHLRIRQPDPYRMQVGCNDFDVPDYAQFKTKYLTPSNPNLRLMKRPAYEMIEFFDPDYDVLAYVVGKEIDGSQTINYKQ